jgi:hypothetical protein
VLFPEALDPSGSIFSKASGMRVLQGLAYSAIGAVSLSVTGAWLYGINVSTCKVPEASALYQMKERQASWFADCYVLRIPRKPNTQRSFSGIRETDAFVKAFFRHVPYTIIALHRCRGCAAQSFLYQRLF